MKTPVKILVVVALAAAVGAAVALKQHKALPETSSAAFIAAETGITNQVARDASAGSPRLPKLLDLGAGKCIPCKMMAPILENLKEEYAGRMEVEFIDVWVNPDAGKPYGVEMIPTQIFFDAEGKELFRHIGFFGREDILAKWEELGVNIGEARTAAPIVRETPAAADTRPRDAVCFLCDGDVAAKSRTIVQG